MSVEFLAHGTTLTLAWFVIINVIVGVVTAAAVAVALRDASKRPAWFWMALRLAPAIVSCIFTVALFVPSYWKYEPRDGVEGFDISLTLLAAAAVVILGAAATRGLTSWLTARRRVQNWMRHARPMALSATALPAFAVDADQPMIALVGVLRPRLLITRGLLEVLSPAELDAAVAHELGHQRGFDNLKRLVMCAAPDVLTYFHVARVIERRWSAAAEHVADRISGPNVAAARCALASALVKVARLTPAVPSPSEPISALISGGEIASRVQRLLSDEDGTPPSRAWRLGVIAAVGCAAAVVFVYPPLLQSVHELTEVLVHSLP